MEFENGQKQLEKIVEEFLIEYVDRKDITIDEVMRFLGQMMVLRDHDSLLINPILARQVIPLLEKSGYVMAKKEDTY